MTPTAGERETLVWSVPQCPFTIESSARVLDDIRLAVVDAFFSLPRGGAEIGGILLGKFVEGRLTITDHAALDCEHAHGPGFTLSEPDEKRLMELLRIHGSFGGGLRPVGWYHSHTRSEIFLSEADLAIHARFFPEPWQVAMVMKPHTFQPARIGFFFREADGSIHASGSYQEITAEGLRVQPMPGPVPTVTRAEAMPVRREPAPALEAVTELTATPTPPPSAMAIATPTPPISTPSSSQATPTQPVPATPVTLSMVYPSPADATTAEPTGTAPPAALGDRAKDPSTGARTEIPSPSFGMRPEGAPGNWSWLVMAAVLLGITGAAVQTREMWLPRAMAAVKPVPKIPAAPAVGLGLNSIDHEGQLQIQWNPNSPWIRQASDAILEITEGTSTPQAIQLDGVHLQAGNFTFAREAENVDIRLIVHQANGPDVREAIGFLGKLARPASAGADPQALKQRIEDQKQAEQLKAELRLQAAKTRKLEKQLVEMKQELKRQQRLKNQVTDKK